MSEIPKMPTVVAKVFSSFPPQPRGRLKALRKLIFQTAALQENVGKLEETLKWGQPAYVPRQSGSDRFSVDDRRSGWVRPDAGHAEAYSRKTGLEMGVEGRDQTVRTTLSRD